MQLKTDAKRNAQKEKRDQKQIMLLPVINTWKP